jgi:drug/metabolite transporter (DMT)-like permease
MLWWLLLPQDNLLKKKTVQSTFDVVTIVEFALVTVIWGSTWLVIKGQLGTVPAVWSVAYRFAIAASVLTLFTVVTGRWRWLSWRGHGFALFIGLAQFALNFNLVYAAETRFASGLVALVFALLVIPNAILSAIFLNAPITQRFVVGATIGVAGLLLLFAHDLALSTTGGDAVLGLLLVIFAVLSASVANVLQAGALARSLPSLPTLAIAMTYGALIDATFAVATAGRPSIDVRPEYWLGLMYLALAASVIAFSVYYRLIRRIGAGPAAYTSVLVPVIALSLSTVFEAYRWTLMSASGAVLALAGLVIALGGKNQKGTPLAPPGNLEILK